MLPERISDERLEPIVLAYFQTLNDGVPYLLCPDELRPPNAFPDSLWVIFAPSFEGGFIVEWYVVDKLKSRQHNALIATVGLGFFLYAPAMLGVLSSGLPWVIGALLFGVTAVAWLFGVPYLVCRPYVRWIARNFRFVRFPDAFRQALQETDNALAKQLQRRMIIQGVARGFGGVGGMAAEHLIGKPAEKISEKAFEWMAEKTLEKFNEN